MRSLRLALVGALAIAAISAVVLLLGTVGPTAGGPLIPPVGLLVNTHLAPGADGTWGIMLVAPEGAEPAILESVAPAKEPVGLTILGINSAVIGDTSVGTAAGYPPADMTLEPVEGTEVPAKGTGPRVQLVIGVRYTGPDAGRIEGLRVNYSVGGRRYAAVIDASLHVTAAE
jgi:hypothetical protein